MNDKREKRRLRRNQREIVCNHKWQNRQLWHLPYAPTRIDRDMVVNVEGRPMKYDFGDLDELALSCTAFGHCGRLHHQRRASMAICDLLLTNGTDRPWDRPTGEPI